MKKAMFSLLLGSVLLMGLNASARGAVQQQAGCNLGDFSSGVADKIAELTQQLPEGVKVEKCRQIGNSADQALISTNKAEQCYFVDAKEIKGSEVCPD